jgi:microcompartment protein CcmK/EutM
MRIARVVGNVVSTIKNAEFCGYKLMIVEFLEDDGRRAIAFDTVDAGLGDTVFVMTDGGGSNIVLENDAIVADMAICGVIDHYCVNGELTTP